jgi:hypothetical protein
MNASGAISIRRSSISFCKFVSRAKIVQRIVKRLHVGIDFFLHVAGQEAQPLARFDSGARQDDACPHALRRTSDTADGDRDIGFARARWPDAEIQLVFQQRAGIGLLRFGPRDHAFAPRADFQLALAEHLQLLLRGHVVGFRARVMRISAATSPDSTCRPSVSI